MTWKLITRRFAILICLAGLILTLAQRPDAAPAEKKSVNDEATVSESLEQTSVKELRKEQETDMKISDMVEVTESFEQAAIESAPVNDNYVIGPKDKLVITLQGKKNVTYRPIVDENGKVSIQFESTIGGVPRSVNVEFSLNGVKFKDLRMIVARELAQYSKEIDPENLESSPIGVDVTLSEIRGIYIWVYGEVNKPGNIHLKTTISSIFNVLAKAGGLTEEASRREIYVHRRASGERDSLDLAFDFLDFLAGGEIDARLGQLEDGDMVVVLKKTRSVMIEGEVKRPGNYEIKEGETLKSVVKIAGGLTPMADEKKVHVVQIKSETGLRHLDIDYGKNPEFTLFDGDVITFNARPVIRRENKVDISGEGVKQPGTYVFQEGMTARSLIELAGGLYDDALLERVILVRTLEDYTPQYKRVDLRGVLDNASSTNLPLQPMDRLVIQSKFEQEGGSKFVEIKGHVKYAGRFPLAKDMKISDLLGIAGGFENPDFKEEAYLEEGSVIRQKEGMPEEIKFHLGKILDGDPTEPDFELESEDSIRVYSVKEIEGEKKVSVTGPVKSPGDYVLTKNLRVSGLIWRCGGFEDADILNGIYLERADLISVDPKTHLKTVRAVNLLAILNGDTETDYLLKRMDELRVYAQSEWDEKRMVKIAGEVNAPGEYELVDKMLLTDLIVRASGLTDAADPERIEVIHYVEPGEHSTLASRVEIVSLPAASPDVPYYLRQGDTVFVRRRAEMREMSLVSIQGQVAYPGDYALERHNETLTDLVRRAGGLIEAAAPKAARLARGPEALPVSINLEMALASPSGDHDPVLLAGDSIEVPKIDWTVEIEGAVAHPHAIQYLPGASLSYYVNLAGGYLREAEKSRALVYYPNGDVKKARRWFFRTQKIEPGCSILIPFDREEEKRMEEIGEEDILPIPSALAPITSVNDGVAPMNVGAVPVNDGVTPTETLLPETKGETESLTAPTTAQTESAAPATPTESPLEVREYSGRRVKTTEPDAKPMEKVSR